MAILPNKFESRTDMADLLETVFPHTAEDTHLSATRGGRSNALQQVEQINYIKYPKTRNFLTGDVTRLSPYLTHGILELGELRKTAQANKAPDKFIQELAWRDYYQRVLGSKSYDLWEDIEPYKTGFVAGEYANQLPEDILTGTTGTCLDVFCKELVETGYLHNHARMWLAGYIVHWRRIKWQAGAKWFLTHLLDGDVASNNLSWQWCASTFSHKPYYYNAENLRRYGTSAYPHWQSADLHPFEGDYEQIRAKLFPRLKGGEW